MQVCSDASSLAHSKYALLRWFEGPQSEVREEFVEIINDQVSQTTVRSSLKLNRATAVTLIGKDHTEEGVVECCQHEKTWFLLTVVNKLPGRDGGFIPDPGLFAVDDFLTEEQEAAILREVADQAAAPVAEPRSRPVDRPVRQFI